MICWKIWPKTLYKTSFHFNALKHVFLCLHIFDCSWNLEVTKSTFYFMAWPASQKENFDGFQSLLFRVIGSVLNQRKVMYVSLHNIYRAALRLVAFFWSRIDPKICWKKRVLLLQDDKNGMYLWCCTLLRYPYQDSL